MKKRPGQWCAQTTLAALLATLPSAFGASTATLTGTIADPSGRAIPGVTVTATRTESNTPTATMTNEAGIYSFPDLQIGTYRIQVSKDGFKTFLRSGIDLHVQDEVALNISLELGSVAESISVEGAAPLVQTTGMGVSTVIDRKLVEDLPLNGRSFQTLFQLTPGVVITPANASNPNQFSVNGQRTNGNYVTVDGVSANIGIGAAATIGPGAAGAQMGTSILGGTNNLVSVDALEEFRIQTSSFAPEYGRSPGGQVSIVTRSGTNQFHGTAFDYFRNDKLDANNWFANQTRQSRPPERQNDFGGVLGGPIRKDRTFFFFSYEGLRLRLPVTATGYNVPSLASRQAAPSALQPFLNAYPLPNGPDLPNGFAQDNSSYSNPSSLDSTSIRVDQRLGKSWSLFGRYSDSPSSVDQRGNGFALSTINHATNRTRTVTGGATWIVTPSISNDTRFNFSTSEGAQGYSSEGFGGATPFPSSLACPFASTPENGCVFLLYLGQPNSFLTAGTASDNRLRQNNLTDSLTFSTGEHRISFGTDLRWLRTTPHQATSVSAFFTGIGPATQTGTFLSGLPSTLSAAALAPGVFLNFSNTSFYAQDIWQVTKRLNLTYGVRWDVNPPPNGQGTQSLSNVDDPSQIALGQAGSPLWSTHYNSFAPRLGIAYSLFSRPGHETVVRAGSGFFYDVVSSLVSSQLLRGQNTANLAYPGVSFPLSGLASPKVPSTPPFSTFGGTDPNLGVPTVYEWNLAVQQALGSARSLDVTYLGSRGIHLVRDELYVNANPTFTGSTDVVRTNADSRYDALQVEFHQRLTRGLQVIANYTLSQSTDDASSDSAATPPSRRLPPQADKALSDFDVRHGGSGAVTYALPGPRTGIAGRLLGGWSADGMLVARTAFPLNVVYTRNFGYGSFPYRPDLVSGVPLYIDDPNVGGGVRLNGAAFNVPVALRQGTLGRNTLHGFGMSQFNSAVHKSFRLTETTALQARFEAFNLFNHPNFNAPAASLGSATPAGVFTKSNTFGLSNSMLNQGLGSGGISGGFSPLYQIGGPRSIQLSLKLTF